MFFQILTFIKNMLALSTSNFVSILNVDLLLFGGKVRGYFLETQVNLNYLEAIAIR